MLQGVLVGRPDVSQRVLQVEILRARFFSSFGLSPKSPAYSSDVQLSSGRSAEYVSCQKRCVFLRFRSSPLWLYLLALSSLPVATGSRIYGRLVPK